MARIALALPRSLEGPLQAELVHHGHTLVARCEDAEELIEILTRGEAECALVAASARYLTVRLMAQADRTGARLVAVTVDEEGERYAAAVGLHEVVAADSGWTRIEAALIGSALAPPPGSGAASTDPAPIDAPSVQPLPMASGPSSGPVDGVELGLGAPMPEALAGGRAGRLPRLPWRRTTGDRRRSQAVADASASAPAPDRPQEPRAVRGEVITVWGPAGSPGRTTIAINLAAELAAEGYRVCLADVDTHGASIAPALGLLDEAPGFAAACRLVAADSLDIAQLERIGQRHPVGGGSMWVLTGIGRPSRWPELSADRVVGVLQHCRNWADYTIVDTSSSLENDEEISSDLLAPRRNAATIASLREADRVIAVGAADPVGLSRFLRAHGDLRNTVLTDRVTVVMNKLRSSAIGAGPTTQVAHTLERFASIVSPVMVPHDQPGLDAAMLAARCLLDGAPRSPARQAIRQLVAQHVLTPVPAAR